MHLIPEEHQTSRLSFNFTPMVDFLFIVIAIFAMIATNRKALYDSQVSLTKCEKKSPLTTFNPRVNTVNLSISALGEYKWLSTKENQTMKSPQLVKEELLKQINNGSLSSDPSKNHILLHIDENAKWPPIANLLFAMNEEGFNVYPVYEKKEKEPFIIK